MGGKRKTRQDYHSLAESKGFKWIGKFPKNTHYKTLWKCSNEHVWSVRYGNIQQGHGCPYCSNHIEKTCQDYHVAAQAFGLEWIGDFPKTTRRKTLWRCLEGHTWKASYNSITKGRGCPTCAGFGEAKTTKTRKDYHCLASTCGVAWIGVFPKTTDHKTVWRCSSGHEWETTYQKIRAGIGCPHCLNFVNGQRASKIQIEIATMIDGIVNFRVGNRHVDIAFPDKKIGIEYDCQYWHRGREEEDQQRVAELIDLGWKIISIKANNEAPTKPQLEMAMLQVSSQNPHVELVLDWA